MRMRRRRRGEVRRRGRWGGGGWRLNGREKVSVRCASTRTHSVVVFCVTSYLVPVVLLFLHGKDGVDMVLQQLVRQLAQTGMILQRYTEPSENAAQPCSEFHRAPFSTLYGSLHFPPASLLQVRCVSHLHSTTHETFYGGASGVL